MINNIGAARASRGRMKILAIMNMMPRMIVTKILMPAVKMLKVKNPQRAMAIIVSIMDPRPMPAPSMPMIASGKNRCATI